MTKRSLPFRTNYFSLAVCKHIFLHSTHGLVFVRNAMRCREAETYELSPVLLYAISIPDAAIRRMTFTPLNQPHALYATLHRLWTQEAESFRGRPDAVMLSRQVAEACPTLADRLAPDGVELIVVDKGDKVSGAALRTAQYKAVWLKSFSQNNQRIDTLDRLDEAAADQHRLDLMMLTGKARQRQEQWAELTCRPVSAPSSGDEMDWTPGPWLNSWEGSLPPVSVPRYFHRENDRKMWLLIGSSDSNLDGSEDEALTTDEEWVGDDDSNPVEQVKNMVACWPNSIAEIARCVGITGHDLKWFVDGKADIDKRTLFELLSVLGIERQEDGYYEASGPCLLIAKNVVAATRIYEELSHGGDLDFSYEVVPESSNTDPSWRYLLFQSCGGSPSIMMFERGSKAADRLNDRFFINFEGVRPVPSRLYRDVVATSARASHSPLANRREMRSFEERQAAVS